MIFPSASQRPERPALTSTRGGPAGRRVPLGRDGSTTQGTRLPRDDPGGRAGGPRRRRGGRGRAGTGSRGRAPTIRLTDGAACPRPRPPSWTPTRRRGGPAAARPRPRPHPTGRPDPPAAKPLRVGPAPRLERSLLQPSSGGCFSVTCLKRGPTMQTASLVKSDRHRKTSRNRLTPTRSAGAAPIIWTTDACCGRCSAITIGRLSASVSIAHGGPKARRPASTSKSNILASK